MDVSQDALTGELICGGYRYAGACTRAVLCNRGDDLLSILQTLLQWFTITVSMVQPSPFKAIPGIMIKKA